MRWASKSENNMNMSKQQKPCSSKYKGVYYDKDKQKWRARITTDTKTIHIGYFLTELDAARAYNTNATELFSAFAHLNIL